MAFPVLVKCPGLIRKLRVELTGVWYHAQAMNWEASLSLM